MGEHTLMGEHPVKRKLRISIVPQIVIAEKLSEQKFYRIHQFYIYLNDVLVFLIGAGVVSSDIFGFITQPQTTVNLSQSKLPTEYLLLIAGIISWALLKTYVKQEDTQKKFELVKVCQMKFRGYDTRLRGILEESNPIKRLEELRKNMENTRDATFEVWISTTEKYQAEIDKRLNSLYRTYESSWTDVPEVERREV